MTVRIVADDDAGRAAAVAALGTGGVVALPTDTVYGLAVSGGLAGAVERLYAAKDRPPDRAIAILCADRAQAETLVSFSPAAARLADALWPGGLTLVLAVRPGALPAAYPPDTATLGVRVPGHPCPRALASALGPLPTTSANRSGEPEVGTAAGIAAVLGGALAIVLDGGPAPGGPASTVVDATGDELRILREGAIPIDRIEAASRPARVGR